MENNNGNNHTLVQKWQISHCPTLRICQSKSCCQSWCRCTRKTNSLGWKGSEWQNNLVYRTDWVLVGFVHSQLTSFWTGSLLFTLANHPLLLHAHLLANRASNYRPLISCFPKSFYCCSSGTWSTFQVQQVTLYQVFYHCMIHLSSF